MAKHRRSRRARGSYGLAIVGTSLLMAGGLIFGTGAAASAHGGFNLLGLIHLGGSDGIVISLPVSLDGCIDHEPPPYVGDGDDDLDDLLPILQECHEHHHHHHHHHHHDND